jgi:hypothetical protein
VFRRLETYVDLPPTTEMMDVLVKVMAEVLLILAFATKEIKQGKLSELIPADIDCSSQLRYPIERFLKKLAGKSDIEGALQRLEKLTQEEHRMATAQDLRATHRVGENVREIMDIVLDGAQLVFASASSAMVLDRFRC